MNISVSLIDLGIVVIGAAALVGVVIAFRMPHRLRPADIDAPSDREAFRGNLIQTLTLVLVVLGAIVALKQLGASLDQLQDARFARFANEIEHAEQRLVAADGTAQSRTDAIADLASLHAKSPEHRVQIERQLQRFVQDHARASDLAAFSSEGVPEADVAAALRFLVTEGQAQTEPEWRFAEGGARLNLASIDLRGLNLQGARLNNADLHASFLQGVDLRQAQMTGVNLTGADLAGANLQQAVLRDSTLANANLEDTRLTGTDLAGSDLRGTTGHHHRIMTSEDGRSF